MSPTEGYRLVVMGASAGGLEALREITGKLPPSFPVPILIVQHLGRHAESHFADVLAMHCGLPVKEVEDKESLRAGVIYTAPANYHVLVERDLTVSLSVEAAVNFSRPSIDVLFESAADAVGKGLIGVLLTGANEDGARGMAAIKKRGGFAIVEDPGSARFRAMPAAGLREAKVDLVLPHHAIGHALLKLFSTGSFVSL